MRRIVVLAGLFACQAPSEDGGPDGAAEPGCPSTFATSEIVTGSITIDDPVAVEALRGIRAISGNLEITADVSLPDLVDVDGDVTIGSATVALPSLCHVGKDVAVSSPDLSALSLPSLEVVGGAVEIQDCPRLVDIDLGALIAARSLGIDSNRALTSVSFPALTTATSLFVTGNDVLAAIDAPNLTSIAQTLMISGNDQLAAFPILTAGSASIIDNPMLQRDVR